MWLSPSSESVFYSVTEIFQNVVEPESILITNSNDNAQFCVNCGWGSCCVLRVYTAEDFIADGMFSRKVNETSAESQRREDSLTNAGEFPGSQER
jgi:hypothetical protein